MLLCKFKKKIFHQVSFFDGELYSITYLQLRYNDRPLMSLPSIYALKMGQISGEVVNVNSPGNVYAETEF